MANASNVKLNVGDPLEHRVGHDNESSLRCLRRKGELNRESRTAGALNSMCVEPLLVLEERAKLQLNVPMMISFGAPRK